MDICVGANNLGVPVPFVMICNEGKAVADIRRVSPKTIIGFRITGIDPIPNPSYETGQQRIRDLATLFGAVKADLYCIANEWVPDTPDGIRAAVNAYMGAMSEAEVLGFKICVGDFPTTHPDMNNPEIVEALKPMLQMATAGGHYLRLNYYPPGGDPTNDPSAMLWKRMVTDYPRLKVIIGEYGPLENDQAMVHCDAFTRLITTYNAMLAPYPQVVGVALYSLTTLTWKQCEWYDERERYYALLRTFAPK